MGARRWRVAGALTGDITALIGYLADVDAGRAAGHHGVAFGMAAGALGVADGSVAAAYLHSSTSLLVGAAQRLMRLGQLEGQRVPSSTCPRRRAPWPRAPPARSPGAGARARAAPRAGPAAAAAARRPPAARWSSRGTRGHRAVRHAERARGHAEGHRVVAGGAPRVHLVQVARRARVADERGGHPQRLAPHLPAPLAELRHDLHGLERVVQRAGRPRRRPRRGPQRPHRGGGIAGPAAPSSCVSRKRSSPSRSRDDARLAVGARARRSARSRRSGSALSAKWSSESQPRISSRAVVAAAARRRGVDRRPRARSQRDAEPAEELLHRGVVGHQQRALAARGRARSGGCPPRRRCASPPRAPAGRARAPAPAAASTTRYQPRLHARARRPAAARCRSAAPAPARARPCVAHPLARPAPLLPRERQRVPLVARQRRRVHRQRATR